MDRRGWLASLVWLETSNPLRGWHLKILLNSSIDPRRVKGRRMKMVYLYRCHVRDIFIQGLSQHIRGQDHWMTINAGRLDKIGVIKPLKLDLAEWYTALVICFGLRHPPLSDKPCFFVGNKFSKAKILRRAFNQSKQVYKFDLSAQYINCSLVIKPFKLDEFRYSVLVYLYHNEVG